MIKYPNKIKHVKTSEINYVNRGLNFEEDINITNKYYLENKLAFIYKKPTPIKIVKCSNYKNSYRIDEAYFLKPSTTDYNGLYRSKYIDFEAKQTQSLTSFPFSNILPNQIEHMLNIYEHGGICFLLINFAKLNQTYLVDAKILKEEIEKGRKSFSIELIKKEGLLVPSSYFKLCDYLVCVDKYYFNEQ